MNTISATHKAYSFLKANPHGVLSTADAGGKPWGSVIYFAVDEDLTLHFMTKVKTLKAKNLAHNASVSLCVYDESLQKTLQLSGAVSQTPVKELPDVVMRKLSTIKPKSAVTWTPPVVKLDAGDYAVFSIKPDYIQFADYGKLQHDIHANPIERIL
jgi:uncharacterized pyridoxamine 5'-phosphate oxidase family protein